MTLSAADIERWDAGAVRQIFHVATARADATFDMSRELSTLKVFNTWGGAAAEAAGHAFAQTRQDLDAHGREALAVANAAKKAAADIEQVQTELRQLKALAEGHGLEVDPASNRIVPMAHSTHGRREMQAAIPGLQAKLDGIVAHGNAVDQELAGAINMADGDRPIPTSGPTATPQPPVPGQPVDPANPFTGDPNFGNWEDVPVPPPYVGATPPPLKPEYRPLPDDSPLKTGGPLVFTLRVERGLPTIRRRTLSCRRRTGSGCPAPRPPPPRGWSLRTASGNSSVGYRTSTNISATLRLLFRGRSKPRVRLISMHYRRRLSSTANGNRSVCLRS